VSNTVVLSARGSPCPRVDFIAWVREGKRPCLGWIEGLRCVEMMEAAYRSADADGAAVDLPLHPELEREPGVVGSSGLADVPDLSGLVGCGGLL
jgi:hypothetical protein